MSQEPKKPPLGLRRAWWYHALPIAALVVADVAFCFMLDVTFSEQKKRIITDSGHFEELTGPYHQFTEGLGPGSFSRETARTYYDKNRPAIEERARKILEDRSNFFWRIIVEDKHREEVFASELGDKLVELNTWENCLFSRSFSGEISRINSNRAEFWAKIRFSYASPHGWPEIDDLVFRYRLGVAAVIGLSVLLYVWLNRSVLRPMVRVASALETMSRSERMAPMPHATTVFERTLNGLVESQRPVHLQGEVDRALREIRKTHHPDDTFEGLLDRLPSVIVDVYDSVVVALYRWDGHNSMLRTAQSGSNSGAKLPESLPVEKDRDRAWKWENPDADEFWLAPLRSRGRLVGAVLADLAGSLAPSHAAESLQRILETGLEAARTDADRLAEERNRFGMTLATSMGHDLTNIIATGKWDLQTLEKARELGIISVDHGRAELYAEAVSGLRQNLHFLQDIVDIYRAVGYARRPSFEKVELGGLMSEVTELFGRSSSKRLDVRCDPAQQAELVVEPRLLKMVVFNLLANASQVIQNRSDGKSGGQVEVVVEPQKEGACIVVRDDGPGIRNHDGQLLQEDSLHKIFRAGYTTKPPEASGGLGLSWAKHIVEDFHGGKITAHNRAEGGAAFRLDLLQRPETDPKPTT